MPSVSVRRSFTREVGRASWLGERTEEESNGRYKDDEKYDDDDQNDDNRNHYRHWNDPIAVSLGGR